MSTSKGTKDFFIGLFSAGLSIFSALTSYIIAKSQFDGSSSIPFSVWPGYRDPSVVYDCSSLEYGVTRWLQDDQYGSIVDTLSISAIVATGGLPVPPEVPQGGLMTGDIDYYNNIRTPNRHGVKFNVLPSIVVNGSWSGSSTLIDPYYVTGNFSARWFGNNVQLSIWDNFYVANSMIITQTPLSDDVQGKNFMVYKLGVLINTMSFSRVSCQQHNIFDPSISDAYILSIVSLALAVLVSVVFVILTLPRCLSLSSSKRPLGTTAQVSGAIE